MASGSRQWIVNRRSSHVADLSNLDVTSGVLNADELGRKGTLSLNNKIEVGIATETEVGLSEDRFPIFVKIVDPLAQVPPHKVDTVVKYWKLVNSTGESVPFSRRPDFNTICISRLYEWIPDFDDEMWTHIDDLKSITPLPSMLWAPNAMYDADQTAFYQNAILANPNQAQIAEGIAAVRRLVALFKANRSYVYITAGVNRNVHFVPHGEVRASPDPAVMSQDQMVLREWLLTILVNSRMIRLRYPNAPDGIVTAAAYCLANNARWGFFEAYEHKEFAVMLVEMKDMNKYTIHGTQKPDALTLPAEFADNEELDISNIKVSPPMIEVASGLNVTSGCMHYLYNHTTGGSQLTGALLSMALLYNLYDTENRVFSCEQQTSIYYEALHNVNKRMIANMILERSKVVTYGRSSISYPLQPLKLDTFMNIRKNAYPAGSHKAFICLIVLRKVLASMFGVFLPWSSEINNVINICETITSSGARAHVGSGYYTGMPAKTQGAELDNYLPELAAFMNTFARNDTLTMSPHLGPDVAARASQSWVSMLNKVKSEDISSTDPKIVKDFLETAGMVQFSFDPADQSTWAAAAGECQLGVDRIDHVMSNM